MGGQYICHIVVEVYEHITPALAELRDSVTLISTLLLTYLLTYIGSQSNNVSPLKLLQLHSRYVTVINRHIFWTC